MNEKIVELKKIIDESKNIVLFTGAGISVPSGIPDFRSEGGLYNKSESFGVPPETVLSHSFFYECPEQFFDYFRKNFVFENAKPNAAHLYFAELEKQGKLLAVVTQNVDDLHERAGSKNVFKIHGDASDFYCVHCKKHYPKSVMREKQGAPKCDDCGWDIRPNIVLYEECLPPVVVSHAERAIEQADTLIVVGTSLIVEPAASMVEKFCGKNLVIVNTQPTKHDKIASLVICEKIEKVVEGLESLEISKE